jgi:hypothetical protein
VERPLLFRAHRDLDRVLSRGSRFYHRLGARRLDYRLERRVNRWRRRAGARRIRRGRLAPAGQGRPGAGASGIVGASAPPALAKALEERAFLRRRRHSQRRGYTFSSLRRRSYAGLGQRSFGFRRHRSLTGAGDGVLLHPGTRSG